jgi:hypothetical protein
MTAKQWERVDSTGPFRATSSVAASASAGLSAEGITSCFEHVLNTIEQSGSVRADRGD